MCYLGVGVAYVIGFAAGDRASCSGPFPVLIPDVVDGRANAAAASASDTRLPIATQGTKNALCTTVFAIQYFFAMSAAVWWTVLAVAWFLSAGPKWGREAIERRSGYFHLVAWAAPAVLTFAAIGTGSIVGDPISGICVAGGGLSGGAVSAERAFVLVPLGVCLGVGLLFLAAGFIALFRVRQSMRRDGTSTDKLERLMVRIGVFGVLYAVPAAVVVACYSYEQAWRQDWTTLWYSRACRLNGVACIDLRSRTPIHEPDFTVFAIKYVMTLIVGVASGFWVWSGKTVSSWRSFYERVCGVKTTGAGGDSRRAMAGKTSSNVHFGVGSKPAAV